LSVRCHLELAGGCGERDRLAGLVADGEVFAEI
jgi:hypothetical protein